MSLFLVALFKLTLFCFSAPHASSTSWYILNRFSVNSTSDYSRSCWRCWYLIGHGLVILRLSVPWCSNEGGGVLKTCIGSTCASSAIRIMWHLLFKLFPLLCPLSFFFSSLQSFFLLHLLLPIIQQSSFLLLRPIILKVKSSHRLNIRWRSLLRWWLLILTRLILRLLLLMGWSHLRGFILTQIVILGDVDHIRPSELPISSHVKLI
jgi:hypothetical protein